MFTFMSLIVVVVFFVHQHRPTCWFVLAMSLSFYQLLTIKSWVEIFLTEILVGLKGRCTEHENAAVVVVVVSPSLPPIASHLRIPVCLCQLEGLAAKSRLTPVTPPLKIPIISVCLKWQIPKRAKLPSEINWPSNNNKTNAKRDKLRKTAKRDKLRKMAFVVRRLRSFEVRARHTHATEPLWFSAEGPALSEGSARVHAHGRREIRAALCSEALLLFLEPGDVAAHNPSIVHEELAHSRLALIVLVVLQLAHSDLTYKIRARQSGLVLEEGD